VIPEHHPDGVGDFGADEGAEHAEVRPGVRSRLERAKPGVGVLAEQRFWYVVALGSSMPHAARTLVDVT